PHYLGQLGQLGTEPAKEAMKGADLLILAGTSYPYRDYLPDDAPAIQIDIEPRVLGKYYPSTVGIVSDAKFALAWLAQHSSEKEGHYLEEFQEKQRKWNEKLQEDMRQQTETLQPQQVLAEIQ